MLELATGIGTWKIEENTVNSGIFNGWGDKGIEALSNMLFSTGFMATKV